MKEKGEKHHRDDEVDFIWLESHGS